MGSGKAHTGGSGTTYPGIARSIILLTGSLILGVLVPSNLNAQVNCDPTVPHFDADLSGNPDTTWISPDTARQDNCCGTTNPDRCIHFTVTLHPDAQGIIFDIHSGAEPPGALFYQVSCNDPTPVGEPLCLNGPGPHEITFCKPGNNNNEYSIETIPAPGVGPDVTVHEGCTDSLFAYGYADSTISWNSVNPSPKGAYNDYLSCDSACDSTQVSVPTNSYPDSIDFEVCGIPKAGCDSTETCDTVRTYFRSDLAVSVQPEKPAVCAGNDSTTIGADGSGGSTPYSYEWSTGDTTQTIRVDSGTYYVELSDSTDCPPAYDTVTVTQFDKPIRADAGPDTMLCRTLLPVDLTGMVDAASGGTWWGGNGVYDPHPDSLDMTYHPDPQEIDSGVVELYLRTTGNGGCPADTDTVRIGIGPPGAIKVQTKDPACKGDTNGWAKASPKGGTAPYEYSWNGGPFQKDSMKTGLGAGTHSVTINDSIGCDTTINFSLTDPPALTVSVIDSTPLSCKGDSDGTATATATGGSPPYSYSWSTNPPQTDSQASGLPAGKYRVTVTDSNGCTAADSVTIIEPSAVQAIIVDSKDALCFGDSNGYAIGGANGGWGEYSYEWSTDPVQQGDRADDLVAGSYDLIVEDSAGCPDTASVLIDEPTPLVPSTQHSNVTCRGDSDATASASATGGTMPYSYKWNTSPQQNGPQASGLTAGTYTVELSDSNGCTVVDTVTIPDPPDLEPLLLDTQDALCYGDSNGYAVGAANGGWGDHSYSWNSDPSQSGDSAIGLSAGPYSLTVTDSAGCTDSLDFTIGQPDPLVTGTQGNDVTCSGDSDGGAAVNVSGGIKPYQHTWSTNPAQMGPQASGLSPGTYRVTITDAHGCNIKDTVTIPDPPLLNASILDSKNTNCNGDSNGYALGDAQGGWGDYSYRWDTDPPQFGDSVGGLAAGDHKLIVEDSAGCTDSANVTIGEPPILKTETEKTDIRCYGADDGRASASPSGGSAPYTYEWNTTPPQNTIKATGLSPGKHVVTITDDSGCQTKDTVSIEEPDSLSLETTVTMVSCYGASDGRVEASVSGGTTPYEYSWDTPSPSSTSTIDSLQAGTYQLTVIDSQGCTDSVSVDVPEPQPLELSADTFHVTCYGGQDGGIEVQPSGGTTPYEYIWDSLNVGGPAPDSLEAGLYKVFVSDSMGCSDSLGIRVKEPDPIQLSIAPGDTICPGDSAQLTVDASGGQGDLSYSWDPGNMTGDSVTVAPTGNTGYHVDVTDTAGCTVHSDTSIVNVKVLFPDSLFAESSGNVCIGKETTLSGEYAGDTTGLDFHWEPVSVDGLGSFPVEPDSTTTYTLIGVNGCGDNIRDSVRVRVHPLPVMDPHISDTAGCPPLVAQFSDSALASGAQPVWDFGDGDTSNALAPTHIYDSVGSYEVSLRVTSPKGCTDTMSDLASIRVHPLPEAGFVADPDPASIHDPEVSFADRSVRASEYFWKLGDGTTDSAVNPEHTYKDTGNFRVEQVVWTDKGCVDSANDIIRIEPSVTIFVPNAFTPDGDGQNDEFFPKMTGMIDATMEMTIFNRWGEVIFESFHADKHWKGRSKGSAEKAKSDVYVYKIRVKDVHGDWHEKKGHVTLLR